MKDSTQSPIHTIRGRVREYNGKGAWHFITIEENRAREIIKDYHWPRRGFGSIPVDVKVGGSLWKTSIFPEKGGTHVLPIKKQVREKENISKGDIIAIELSVSN